VINFPRGLFISFEMTRAALRLQIVYLSAGLTFPMTAWPPSLTCTCSTRTC
jgi:hypothetical protein